MNFNESAAQTYSNAFAAKICNDFYQSNDTISGEQILKLTELKQINVFIIAEIYKNWKAETEQFVSPYFDYHNPQVSLALQNFMNTVSKNISVKKNDLEPIVSASVKQTVELLVAPKKYFERFIKDNNTKYFTREQSNVLEKYTKIHQNIVEKIITKYTELIEIDTNTLVSFVDNIEDTAFENPTQYLEQMSRILPVTINDFWVEDQTQNTEIQNIEEGSQSFFDNIEDTTTIPNTEIVTEEIFIDKVTEDLEIPIVEKEQPEQLSGSLNDQFAEPKTIKELLLQETEGIQSVHDLNTNNKIESITASISLNKKFIFIGRLFGGDINAYNKSVEELDNFTNYLDARNYINKSLSPNYNWMMATEEAEEFLELVANRYK